MPKDYEHITDADKHVINLATSLIQNGLNGIIKDR